jgi:hypothetical protein
MPSSEQMRAYKPDLPQQPGLAQWPLAPED